LRTTFGVLRSTDGGVTWTWLCEDVLGLSPNAVEDPSFALTSTNALVAGLSLGLKVSPDTGCSWTTIGGGLTGQHVEDLVVRPDSPDTVLALTSTFEPDAGVEGGAGYLQQIYASSDDGATWTAIGAVDPSATVTTIEVAATDPQRIYVSAFRGQQQRTTSLFVSEDGGRTWTEHATPFDPSTETAVYIAAVDPHDADRVYVRSNGNAGRLMVTSDAGSSFQIAFELGDQMEGFALSPDGSRVYVGGPNVGLFAASTADFMFQPLPEQLPDGTTQPLHVQCLAAHGGDLWACSDEPSGFIAGVSRDQGATFAARLHFTTIAGPTACPVGTTSRLCTSTDFEASAPYEPFASLCSFFGACDMSDVVSPFAVSCVEAGACGTPDAGASPGAAPKSSCGCSVVGGGGAAGGLAALALFFAIAGRRRPQ
jgi:MYXO-CTERM domain-containing protein